MEERLKEHYEREVIYQTKMLKRLSRWMTYSFAASSVGVVLCYISSSCHWKVMFAVSIAIIIIFTLIGTAIGLAIKNGTKNIALILKKIK